MIIIWLLFDYYWFFIWIFLFGFSRLDEKMKKIFVDKLSKF